jgi:hypothetical protein
MKPQRALWRLPAMGEVSMIPGDDNAYREFCDSRTEVYPDDDFEGVKTEVWPDGTLRFRGMFKKGARRVGQHISFWENGLLEEISYWDDRWPSGTTLWFYNNGTKECEKDYGVYGGRTREWVERHFDEHGTLFMVLVYRNDSIVAEWIEPSVRKDLVDVGSDDIIERALDQFVRGKGGH